MNKRQRKPKGQSRMNNLEKLKGQSSMDNLEKLATLGTHDRGRKQTNKQKHNTEN